MAPKAKDLTGQVVGRLTALHRDISGKFKATRWIYQCSCGNIKSIASSKVFVGGIVSCGCYSKERSTKHGLSGDHNLIYKTWKNIRQRCTNPRHVSYPRYGGKGIYVDERWNDFEVFAADMGPRPIGCSIDRIDSSGPYSPENCKWSTALEQSNNTSSNRKIIYKGAEMTIAQLSAFTDIKRGTLYDRICKQKLSVEEAISRPPLSSITATKTDKTNMSTEEGDTNE